MIQAEIIPDLSHGEPRRSEPRFPTDATAALRKLGASGGTARLLNISSRGFMAETDSDIDPGTRVWLSVPGLPRLNALVIWAKSGRIGCEFSDPVDPLIVLESAGRAASPANEVR